MANNYILTAGTQQFKHWKPDGTLLDTLDISNFGNSTHSDSDGNLYYHDTSNDEIVQIDQNLNEQWRVPLYGYSINDIAEDDNHIYVGATQNDNVKKVIKSDGEVVWDVFAEVRGTSGMSLDDSDGLWVGENDGGEGYVFRLDAGDGTRTDRRQVASGNIEGVIYHDDFLYVSDSSNNNVIRKIEMEYFTPEWGFFYNSTTNGNDGALRMDSDGNLYQGGNSGIASYDSSDGSERWSIDLGARASNIGVHPDGVFIGMEGGSDRFRKYTHDGTEVFRKAPHGGNTRWATAYPNYDDAPDAWITKVTKSASGTTVASSGTMNTASGSMIAEASASATDSQSVQNTASGAIGVDASASATDSQSTLSTSSATSSATPQATVTALSVTPRTAAPTTTAAPRATTVTSTATMRTVDTSVPVSATGVESSSSMKTASTVSGVDASATTVALAGTMQTPSVITKSTAPVSDFGYVGTRDGLFKYDIDGTLQWSIASINAETTATDSAGDVYAVDAGSSTLYAYNSTGAEKWNVPLSFSPDRLEVGEDGALYAIESGSPSTIEQFDTATGAFQWTDTWNHEVASTTIDADESLYIGSRDGRVQRWDNDGTVAWTRDVGADFQDGVHVVADGSGSLFVHTLEDDGTGGTVPSVKQLDSADGSTSATKSVGYDTLNEFAVDDESNLYLAGGSGPVTLERYDYTAGTSEWAIDAGYSVNDLDVTASGQLYAVGTAVFGESIELREYDMDDGSVNAIVDTVSGSLAFYPDYASNQTAWMSRIRTSLTANHVSSTGTMATAAGDGGVNASPTSVGGSATMATASPATQAGASGTQVSATGGATVVSSASTATPVATRTGSTVSPQVPSGTGTADASATMITGHVIPNIPFRENARTASATVLSTETTMGQPVESTRASSVATVAEAEAVPHLSTSVSTTAGASAVTYEATSMMPTPGFAVRIGASSIKHGATASTLTALEFERQIRELGSGPNGSALSGSQNRSELTNSNNE